MQSRRLIIDANILVRAVLGVRVRELIERYCESAAFYVAESNFEEAMQCGRAGTATRNQG